jgi:hypothetical protein
MMRATIASPSPVPPVLRGTKGSKICSRTASGIPGPVSQTVYAANLARSGPKSSLVDLAIVDVIAHGGTASIEEGSFRQSVTIVTLLAELNDADAFGNIVAGTLRLHLPSNLPPLRWICVMKIATGLSAGGVPPTLAALTNELGVEAELAERVRQHCAKGASAEMWATAIVIAALVRSGCSTRRALTMSQVITPPYLDIPAIDDDVAWRYLPDDVLAGLHKCRHDFPDIVVERAWREIGCRRAAGHISNLRAIN